MSRFNQEFSVGEKVRIDDEERRPFVGVLLGKNKKNSAEFEIECDGKVWLVHWCWIHKVEA